MYLNQVERVRCILIISIRILSMSFDNSITTDLFVYTEVLKAAVVYYDISSLNFVTPSTSVENHSCACFYDKADCSLKRS